MTTTQLLNIPLSSNHSPLAAGSEAYHSHTITTLAEFEALKTEWNDFLKQTGTHNLCLTHGWLLTWLQHFPPEQLLIIIVKDAHGQWVGAAPLKISKSKNGLSHRLLRQVQFIGTQPTVFDWMKFAISPAASQERVIEAIAAVLRQSKWDVLDLQFHPDESQLRQLERCLQPNGKASGIQETTPIPYLKLPATETEYEKVRRKKTRLEVNRHCNRFSKEFGSPLQLEFQPATEASDAILTRFFAGHIKYWAEKKHKSDFQRFPKLFHFYKDMLAYSQEQADESEPKLLFSVLKMEEYQLSYHLGFWQGNGYLSHITHFNQGFKGYSPGTVHMDKLVFDTIARGGLEFEFGRGDEPYKKMWTQEKKPLWRLRMFRSPLSAAIWQVDILLKRMTGKSTE